MKWLLSAMVSLALVLSVDAEPAGQPAGDPAQETMGKQQMPPCHKGDAEMPMGERGCGMQKQGCKMFGAGPWMREGCEKPCFPGVVRCMPAFIVLKMAGLLAFFCMSVCTLLHILLTILVFTDMRARKDVNGLWIAIVLVGGLFATIAYALFTRRQAQAA